MVLMNKALLILAIYELKEENEAMKKALCDLGAKDFCGGAAG